MTPKKRPARGASTGQPAAKRARQAPSATTTNRNTSYTRAGSTNVEVSERAPTSSQSGAAMTSRRARGGGAARGRARVVPTDPRNGLNNDGEEYRSPLPDDISERNSAASENQGAGTSLVNSTVLPTNQRQTSEHSDVGESVDLKMSTINEEFFVSDSKRFDVRIEGEFGEHQISGAVSIKDLNLPTQTLAEDFVTNLGIPEKIRLRPYHNTQAMILIGQDNWKLIATREMLEAGDPCIALSRTLLGWAAH
ncbi:hypothetical protein QAD02_001499 [Eretmocerus hayati]|uniref:Uncharacterized protein n=1 Tax=Eretmocerus hayati TaxID=131215 RepID=A0ACC2NGA5_9HYME|nr:hypothetical protein QAD02_001499 [Eretmocerus hayati]